MVYRLILIGIVKYLPNSPAAALFLRKKWFLRPLVAYSASLTRRMPTSISLGLLLTRWVLVFLPMLVYPGISLGWRNPLGVLRNRLVRNSSITFVD